MKREIWEKLVESQGLSSFYVNSSTTKKVFSMTSTITAVQRLPKSTPESEGLYIEVVNDLQDLKSYAAELEELSSATSDANPFYEDWMLLPAFKFLKADLDLRIVLIFARDHSQSNQRLLCGVFPLVLHNRWKGLPNRVYSLWQHRYCPLCTPLIRNNYGRQCLVGLFNWLSSVREGCLLIEFNSIRADGPFNSLLSDFLRDRQLSYLTFNRFVRGTYHPKPDLGANALPAVSSKYQSQLRRKRTRLSEMGNLQFAELQLDGDASRWIDEFLNLEARGWKGREESALDCNEASRSFFVEAAEQAFRRGRLRMLELRLDGELLAQRCSFVSGQESFLFKLAYNEDFARFSPGVLLELENMKSLDASMSVEDSCASPDHPVFMHLWVERKMIQTTLASWSRSGALAISAMELYRWLNKSFGRPFGNG